MKRCIELARLGAGSAAPNPMVGSVIVHKGKIIGEGYHRRHGEAHAEVNAVNSVSERKLLKESTIYVSLEPCAHYGLTPPCSDLIIENKIPKVVIGSIDPFAKVAGKGIEKLQKAGVEVVVGVLKNECNELNKRFFTFHQKKRPYVILKWAQTLDGFIDIERTRETFGEPTWITGDLALRLVHKIRAEEDAILVGTNTVEKDNPSLTVRYWPGNNPLRVTIDNKLRLSQELNLFNQKEKTFVFNSRKNKNDTKISWIKIDFEKELVKQILDELYKLDIHSIIIEGGKHLLQTFIDNELWDETHMFIGNTFFERGIKAPEINGKLSHVEQLDSDKLFVFNRR